MHRVQGSRQRQQTMFSVRWSVRSLQLTEISTVCSMDDRTLCRLAERGPFIACFATISLVNLAVLGCPNAR